MLHRSQSTDGDRVPCEFKNLHSNTNAVRIICKNINTKLKLQRDTQQSSIEHSDVEQTSCYDRKIAYFIRFHLRDILTSDHRHVWFHIQTKSLEDMEARSQILKNISEEISVVYSFGSMFSYDIFIGHFNERALARISVPKFSRTMKLETATHQFIIEFRNMNSQVLINHSTSDNSIQVIFMLKSPPIIESRNGIISRDNNKRMTEEIPLCSDLLLRFYPASTAWTFLRELPIAGYSRRASDDLFHVNFAIFSWQKDASNYSFMGQPSYKSFDESYGIDMLWSLGYRFRDKYNVNSQSISGKQQKEFYDLCCTIWRNLKDNHCYQICNAIIDQKTKKNQNTTNSTSSSKKVAFAVITPCCIEYQPMQTTVYHRGFDLYPPENWLLIHMRGINGLDKLNNLELQTRVHFRNLMLKGISRDKYRYQYFGSSNSQMKDQAGWFLSLPPNKTMESVREELGDLSKIHNVSTYTARVGLYLTTTKSTGVKLIDKGKSTKANGEPFIQRRSGIFSSLGTRMRRLFYKTKEQKFEYMAIIIPDTERNGYCFTDGCGKISFALAKKISLNIGIRVTVDSDVPSAFQVRIAGCKGMLSIDPQSKPNEYYILVRESMVKFESDDWTLHIVDHSRPMPLSLNNQIIRLLSDLGNSNGIFESIQTRCIDQKHLWHPPAKSYLNAFESLDQSVIEEKRLKYRNVKHFLQKNKIPLPVNEARCLFGIADETGLLKPGQCFIQYRVLEFSPNSERYWIHEGPVIVTRNPCLHPGDIRKLQAVSVPVLESRIRDCIVFSVQGARSSFHEMAGGDLDGDQYWVYWGNELEINNVAQPLPYLPANKSTGDRITNEAIVDHVLDAFIDNIPGLIANTHKVIADKHPSGTRSKECEECAVLFARAIDACKTGEKIPLDRVHQLREQYYRTCPAWMMKFDKPPMDPPSTSINEILYRKALEAWIHQDNFQDILRPLSGVELPDSSLEIEIDDPNSNSEVPELNVKAVCCSTLLCIVYMAIMIAVVVFIYQKLWKKH